MHHLKLIVIAVLFGVVALLVIVFSSRTRAEKAALEQSEYDAYCLEESVVFSTFDSTYTTMQEAERKLIQALKSHEQEYYVNNHELVDFVRKEPRTLDYPFRQLQEEMDIDVVTSADGNLRVYTWDTNRGGTMIIWGTIAQFRTGDTIHTVHNADVDFEEKDIDYSDTVMMDSYVRDIHTLYDRQGQPIYLMYSVFRVCAPIAMYIMSAARIGETRLEPAHILLDEEGQYDHTVAIEGSAFWDSVYVYHDTILSALVVDSVEVGDYYRHYRFDGERMQYIGMLQSKDSPL